MGIPDNIARSKAQFGQFEILETLGQGGMGIVYRVHDTALDRTIAIKVLKDDLRSHAGVVARFQREAEAVATLNHPNIVHIYSVGSIGRIPYIAMEYINGGPLSRTMKQKRQINWKWALKIAEEVASALACAHEAQIIHRDVKPGNILLDTEGRAFVSDFGIAKVLTAETQLTIEGSRLGTPEYMSPESCQNQKITTASDIYSLGVVLFQMLTGRLPYEAPTPVTLIRKIVVEPPSRLRDYLPNAPIDLERIVAFMIEKRPEHRPADGEELAAILGRMRAGKPFDEAQSGMGAALAEFRMTIPTPATPTGTPTPGPLTDAQRRLETPKPARPSFVTRILNKLPEGTKTFVLSTIVVLVAALVGWRIAIQMDRVSGLDVVRRVNLNVAGWTDDGAPVRFRSESGQGPPAVISAEVNLDQFKLEGLRWTEEGNALVRVQGLAGTQRAGQAAVCVLSPHSQTASLLIPPFPAEDGVDLFTTEYLGDISLWEDRAEKTRAELTITSEAIAGAASELFLKKDKTGPVVAELGRGESAVWHPRKDYVVATVVDRKGNAQLWAVQTQSPYARQQLTFLNDGVRGEPLLAKDGAWALSEVQNATGATIVFVELSRIPY